MVGRIATVWRSRMLSAFTGNPTGQAEWVQRIAEGDDAGYFGPDSAAWVVHGGMATLPAGIRALLMQTLHPGAMAGVHDWSRYREDPLGRLTGTIQWLVSVTFSDRAGAERESSRVGRFHDRVRGSYLDADGHERPYSAGDPELLSWVHVVFTDAFLGSHRVWGGAIPGGADGYVREWAVAGELVGVVDPPRSHRELEAALDAFEPRLLSDERVAEAVRFIRSPGLPAGMMPAYRLLFAGAVASIPKRYRRRLGLRRAWWPAITLMRVVLLLAGRILGTGSSAESAARRRLARLDLASRENDSRENESRENA